MFYIGIDPGKKDLKTTGICVLKETDGKFSVLSKTIIGKNAPRVLLRYLKGVKVISIEAPITYGRGKGKMRLWEKFFSQKPFRKRRASPLPPAFMGNVIDNSMSIVNFLRQKGFRQDVDIIETFYPLLRRVLKKSNLPKFSKRLKTHHEYQAFLCSYVAYLHYRDETFLIGARDGKVFLPKPEYWLKREWKWFEKAWQRKHPFKYKFLKSSFP